MWLIQIISIIQCHAKIHPDVIHCWISKIMHRHRHNLCKNLPLQQQPHRLPNPPIIYSIRIMCPIRALIRANAMHRPMLKPKFSSISHRRRSVSVIIPICQKRACTKPYRLPRKPKRPMMRPKIAKMLAPFPKSHDCSLIETSKWPTPWFKPNFSSAIFKIVCEFTIQIPKKYYIVIETSRNSKKKRQKKIEHKFTSCKWHVVNNEAVYAPTNTMNFATIRVLQIWQMF